MSTTNGSTYHPLVPVTDRAGKHVPNLFTRNGQYYLQAQVRGKRYLRSCPAMTQTAAAKWCRNFVTRARLGTESDQVALEASKQRSPYPKLQRIFQLYRQAGKNQYAVHGRPLPATIEKNIRMLCNLLKKQGHGNPESASVQVLTDDLVDQYFRAAVEGAGDNHKLQSRARLTAASTVRQAKSVFSKWARQYYEKAVSLPPGLHGFLAAGQTVKRRKYTIPPEELREATFKAAEVLKIEKPDLFAVFLLCYDLGMRAGEAAEAKWSWVETRNGNGQVDRYIRICEREDWKGPKNMVAHDVPISDETWADLQAVRRPGDEYILAGGSPTNRANLIQRQFAAWFRSIGWDRETYPKAAHELRKLAGSTWYTEAGLEWAAEWLGDSAATVHHFYAATTRRRAAVKMR